MVDLDERRNRDPEMLHRSGGRPCGLESQVELIYCVGEPECPDAAHWLVVQRCVQITGDDNLAIYGGTRGVLVAQICCYSLIIRHPRSFLVRRPGMEGDKVDVAKLRT